MQSSSFRLVSAVVTLLLLMGIVGVVALVVRTTPTSSLATTHRSTPISASLARTESTTAATLVAQQSMTQPSLRRIQEGGFSFTALPNYGLDVTATSATLTNQDGTIFLLRGGPPEQLSSVQSNELAVIFAEFVTFYASRDQFQSRNQETITVSGVPGVAVDLVSDLGNQSTADHFAGRIVMVQPNPGQLFLLVGISPATAWESGDKRAFATLVDSIQFFALSSGQLVRSATLRPTTVPTTTGAAVAILRATPTPTLGAKATNRAAGRNTPTPTVPALPAPVPMMQPNWRTYSNANRVNDLYVANTQIWAATDGGVGVWDRNNNTFVKFTTIDGLAVNRTTTVVDCPLPGFGLIFGSNQGLQIFEQARGSWKTLNSTNSEMHFDDVSTLYCSPEHGFLVVGYAEHGLELFDVKNGWTLLDQRRGLPQNSVKALTVIGDREAIWISLGQMLAVLTENGVIVYDKSNTPLETAPITVITSDAQGVVWLGAGNKVYRINGKEWTIYSDTYVLASPFPAGEISALALVDAGNLWIGSTAGELCLFDPVAVTCQAFFGAQALKSANGIKALTVDALGRLYVATAGDGVRIYDDKAWRTYRVADDLILGNQVRAFAQDSAGLLWLATETGLYQIDSVTERIVQSFTNENTPYPVTEITTLYPAAKGGLWVGGKGVGYFDGIRWMTYTMADGLASDRIQAIAGDTQKRIWFGTAAGLSIWNGDTFFTLTRADRLPSDNILALLADGETMWIGSDAGLLRFVGNQFQIYTTATTALADNRVTVLVKVTDGALLVGTAGGVSRWVANEMSIIAETQGYSISAIGMMEDEDTLWLGTHDNGLFYFDGKSWTLPPGAINPPDQQINAIAVDRQGSVWLAGAEGGMLRYIP